jgi:hypothetical protein
MARKKKEQTPEEIEKHHQDNIENGRREKLKSIAQGFVPKPTRQFNIGDRVELGGHQHVVILDKQLDGMLYLAHCKYDINETGAFSPREKSHDSKYWVLWMDLYSYREFNDFKDIPQFKQNEDMRLQFYQTSISSFSSLVYYFGVNTEPDYQRGLVWTLEDKQKLIDSIFKGIDIGKFVFIQKDYDRKKNETEHLYEILDGKQRLTTIMEFWEDRFQYNGLFYSQMHPIDQAHFDGYSISQATVTNPTKEQIYRYFLRLNTGGKPMDESQFKKVEGLLTEEIKSKK